MILKDNQEKLEQRLCERRQELGKHKKRTEQYREHLTYEIRGELKDFHDFKNHIRMIEHLNAQRELGRELPPDFSFSSDDHEPTTMISLWERLSQREAVAKEEWKPIGDNPQQETNRIASFSRGFKELDKYDARTKDMQQIIQHLENNLVAIKEKKRIIEKRAKDCYEVVINSDDGDWLLSGFVSLITYMHEMEFDIKYLQYPNNLIDAKSFEFVVKYTRFLHQMEEATKTSQAYSLKNVTKNASFFAECRETISKSLEAGKTWRQPDQLDKRVEEFIGLLPQGLNTKDLDVNQSKVLAQLALEVFRRDFVRFMLHKDKEQLKYVFGTKEIDLLVESVIGKVQRVIPDENPNKATENDSETDIPQDSQRSKLSSKRIKFERPKVKLAMLHTFDASYSSSKSEKVRIRTSSAAAIKPRSNNSLNRTTVSTTNTKKKTSRSRSGSARKKTTDPVFAQYKRGFFQSKKQSKDVQSSHPNQGYHTDTKFQEESPSLKNRYQATLNVANLLNTTTKVTEFAKNSQEAFKAVASGNPGIPSTVFMSNLTAAANSVPKTALKPKLKHTTSIMADEKGDKPKKPEHTATVKWGDQQLTQLADFGAKLARGKA